MLAIEWPVVVVGEVVLVFRAERDFSALEWIDIDDGIYRPYDRLGRALDFVPAPHVARSFWPLKRPPRVTVRLASAQPPSTIEELRERLSSYLDDVTGVLVEPGASLDELILRVLTRQGFA